MLVLQMFELQTDYYYKNTVKIILTEASKNTMNIVLQVHGYRNLSVSPHYRHNL